jgi:hypothetical protein
MILFLNILQYSYLISQVFQQNFPLTSTICMAAGQARVFTGTKQDCTEYALSSVYNNLFVMKPIS